MKMYLTRDEWFPVYGLSKEDKPYLTQYVVDVSEELFEEWFKMEELFDEMQEKLSKLPTKMIKPTEKVW